MGLDIVVVLVVAFGFYAGYSRGFVKTVFDTMSLVIAILASMKLSVFTQELLESIFNIPEGLTFLISLVITFVVVMAAIRFVGRRIEDVFVAANINIINKLAGGALQGVFFAFILSMLIWTLGNYNVMKSETRQGSITYPLLEPLPEAGKAIFTAMKPIFQTFWENTSNAMDSLAGKSDAAEPSVKG